MNITERFLKYVSFTTTADDKTKQTPSTPGQLVFAQYLVNELNTIGMEEVELDENGYIMATLPANIDKKVPVIGFVSHIDTSPDMTAIDVKPSIIRQYDGKDILLNKEKEIFLSTKKYPDILQYMGQDIIVTDGTTLLGADDKAGVTAIVTAMEYLVKHPEIPHGKVRIAFTPDEEIGQGADHFDVPKFGAEWAYTIDGGEIGELEYENFNAAGAKITFTGLNVHPGYAKNKLVNSMLLAQEFVGRMPKEETPEKTTVYEGFFHLVAMEGTVEKSTLNYIIRDHDQEKFELRKLFLMELIEKMNAEYGPDTASIEIHNQYFNMREKIEPVMHIVDLAFEAMTQVGVTPKVKPIRGGTDGSRLSFEGLPCPNIFAGGHNFHGRFEYLPIPSLEKAKEVVVEIIRRLADLETN